MLYSQLPVKKGFLFVRVFRFSAAKREIFRKQGGSRYPRHAGNDTNNKEVPLDAR